MDESLTPYDRIRLLATAEHREPATPPRSASGTLPHLRDFMPFLRVLYRRCLIRIFTVRSTTCRPETAPLGIDCGRHPSCVV
ncbi:hypothetical protein [uncultured Duncaniella sp.]|uniref:hypothetical protein n=1 Tax=uncultured Duncaniella sp. TaxID=2768039 RepID=UPI0025B67BE8|nr:hypothetical protein [uncultured Duncaniella sp.]